MFHCLRENHNKILVLFSQRSPFSSTTCDSCTFTDKCIKTLNNSGSSNKITVVGVGATGIAISVFLLTQRLTQHLVLFDPRSQWIKAEALDLLHASSLLSAPKIETCSDGSHTKNSKIVIVTAGARSMGESRLAVAQATFDMLAKTVPPLVKLSPKATYIIASNPCDVVTWAIQKITKIPVHRCFSSGCWLDSLRFRYFIGKRLKLAPTSIEAFVIGEHGNNSVPVWSGLSVGGISLINLIPEIGLKCDKEKWSKVHEDVVGAAKSVITGKGYTNWGVALAVVDIVKAMQENSGRIVSVGTDCKGLFGIEDSVYLSLPCAINSKGIGKIIKPRLSDFEKGLFKKSALTLLKAQCNIKFK